MSSVITVHHRTKDPAITGPNQAFSEAMAIVAEAYAKISIKTGQRPDFVIVDSVDIADICLSNQHFFPIDLQQALAEKGFDDVRVRGLGGGSRKPMLERIMKEGDGAVEYLDGRGYMESAAGVLYGVSREG